MTRLAITTILARVLVAAALFVAAPDPSAAQTAPLEREPAFRDNLYDVAVRGDRVWIVGYYGTILHSNDRGLNWEVQASGTREALFRVVFVDDRKGWVSGSYGTILHTTNAGKSWQAQPSGVEEQLFGLHFSNERRGWAAGSRGTILQTEDAGANWLNHSIGEDIILNDILFKDDRQGWVAGEFGRIYHSRNGGRSWVKQPSPVEVSFESGESRNLFRLLFPDSDGGWVFGLDGVILRTRNGALWEPRHADGERLSATAQPGPKAAHHHLFSAAAANGKTWAVGERGTILFAALGQSRWQAAKIRTPPVSLNGIAFNRDGLGIIVGNRGTILRTEDGGGQWKPITITPVAPGKGLSRIP
jgi:photosystem II stability/assembly factor-like uncharacterized protein